MNKPYTLSGLGKRLVPLLMSALIGAFALIPGAYAQDAANNCGPDGLEPCPGTLPTIWPDRSAATNAAARILGWNLQPLTDYELVFVAPDQSVQSGVVKTDEQGDLLGDNVREDGQMWGTPYRYEAAPDNPGLFEVHAYVFPWSGDLGEPAVAVTTFYLGSFGQ